MKSSDPHRAYVRGEISIHDAINAVEHFAENYPIERLSQYDANRVLRAARRMNQRVAERDFQQVHQGEIVASCGSVRYRPIADGQWIVTAPSSPFYSSALMLAQEILVDGGNAGYHWEPYEQPETGHGV